jgi:uncharacterized protein (TIGR02588 family)
MAQTNKPNSRAQERPPFLEWLLGGVGVVLLAACVSFLVYEGLRGDEQPGTVSATVKDIVSREGTHIVTFEVHNAGTQTLSNLQLTARVLDGDREIERVTTTIDYLPGRSRQEGGFYLQHDPRRYKLDIAPEGYQKP